MIFAGLLIFALFFLAIGVYANDVVYMLIGGLLGCAAVLIFPEIGRVHRHPFR